MLWDARLFPHIEPLFGDKLPQVIGDRRLETGSGATVKGLMIQIAQASYENLPPTLVGSLF